MAWPKEEVITEVVSGSCYTIMSVYTVLLLNDNMGILGCFG